MFKLKNCALPLCVCVCVCVCGGGGGGIYGLCRALMDLIAAGVCGRPYHIRLPRSLQQGVVDFRERVYMRLLDDSCRDQLFSKLLQLV